MRKQGTEVGRLPCIENSILEFWAISKLDFYTFFVSFFLLSEILEDFGFFSTIFSQISVFLLPNSEINKMISLSTLVYIGHSNSDWNSIYAVRREIFSKYLISLP